MDDAPRAGGETARRSAASSVHHTTPHSPPFTCVRDQGRLEALAEGVQHGGSHAILCGDAAHQQPPHVPRAQPGGQVCSRCGRQRLGGAKAASAPAALGGSPTAVLPARRWAPAGAAAPAAPARRRAGPCRRRGWPPPPGPPGALTGALCARHVVESTERLQAAPAPLAHNVVERRVQALCKQPGRAPGRRAGGRTGKEGRTEGSVRNDQ